MLQGTIPYYIIQTRSLEKYEGIELKGEKVNNFETACKNIKIKTKEKYKCIRPRRGKEKIFINV